MLRCHLPILMDQRRLRIAQVARLTGLNRSTVSALYHQRASRIDLQALERLCEFFDCGVGELLERVGHPRDTEV